MNEKPSLTIAAPSQIREMLQTVPRIAVGAAAVCFTLGLLIVNFWLARFGVHSRDFVRSEYVLVGATFAALVSAAGVGVAYCIEGIKESAHQWKSGKRIRASRFLILSLAAGVGLPIGVIRLVSGGQLDYQTWGAWGAVGLLVVAGLSARDIVRYSLPLWHAISTANASADRGGVINRLGSLFISGPALLAASALYAYYVYPLLSPAYGGGYSEGVVLVPTAEGRMVCVTLGLQVNKDGTVGPVRPLTESDAELIVARFEDGTSARGIHIDRKLLYAFATAKPEKVR